jgi:hypothetical protein
MGGGVPSRRHPLTLYERTHMRFAGKYGHLVVQVQREITEAYATGAVKTLQPNIWAAFKPGGLQAFEREVVIKQWTFAGSYQEMDEATTVPPDYRIGVFDSVEAQGENGWTDETRELVEKALLDLVRFDYIIALPRTTMPAPWPNYDEYRGSVGALVKKLEDDGHDLEQVLAYEQASQNRPALVTALEEKLSGFAPEPKEEEIVA